MCPYIIWCVKKTGQRICSHPESYINWFQLSLSPVLFVWRMWLLQAHFQNPTPLPYKQLWQMRMSWLLHYLYVTRQRISIYSGYSSHFHTIHLLTRKTAKNLQLCNMYLQFLQKLAHIILGLLKDSNPNTKSAPLAASSVLQCFLINTREKNSPVYFDQMPIYLSPKHANQCCEQSWTLFFVQI